MNEVLTLEEVADYLRVHYTTVRRWCREGRLPAVRVGRTYRVRRTDLDEWWDRRAAAAEAAVMSGDAGGERE